MHVLFISIIIRLYYYCEIKSTVTPQLYRRSQLNVSVPEEVNMVAFVDGVFDGREVCLFLYDTVQLFGSCWHDTDMEMILSVCAELPAWPVFCHWSSHQNCLDTSALL